MKTIGMAATMAFAAALPLAGCTTADQPVPLVFGRTQAVGISVAGSVPDQGAHLTIGFSDRNLAIVPTSTVKGDPIRAQATNGFTDALSVLGQFEANAKAQEVSAGLGTFFSTGMASRYLAEGFSCKLAPNQGECTAQSAGDDEGNVSDPE
jgi:hypothetical protein